MAGGVIKTYPSIDTGVGNHAHVTGTDVATNKRALDAYIKNPASDPVPVAVSNAELVTPTIYNLTSPVGANTEFSQVLSLGTKQFTIIAAPAFFEQVNFAFVLGQAVAGPFYSVPAGSEFVQSNLLLPAPTTLYLATPNAGSVGIQILEWI